MNNQPLQIEIDAFLPPAMAAKMEAAGVKKASQDFVSMFSLAVLAGGFISCGAVFATTVTAGLSSAGVGYGIIKLLSGLVFLSGAYRRTS